MRFRTAKEIATIFQIPLARVYELARTGVLPFVRLGERQIRFNEQELLAWSSRGGFGGEPENEEDGERPKRRPHLKEAQFGRGRSLSRK